MIEEIEMDKIFTSVVYNGCTGPTINAETYTPDVGMAERRRVRK